MRTFTTYLVLRLLGPSGFLFRVSSLGGHGLYLGSCGCVRARFSKFGLKKDVEVVRRVLSVERKQMDRRMEKWAWDERCVCVVEAGFGRLQSCYFYRIRLITNIVTSHQRKTNQE